MSHKNDLHAAIQKLLSDHDEYYPYVLEQRFPHVLQRVIAYWGNTQEMETYLDNLLAPPKPPSKGFPQEAILEMVTIRAVHRAAFVSESVPPAATPEVPVAPLPGQPTVADNEAHDDHEAAMIFDRVHRR